MMSQPFTIRRRVQFAETDMAGVMHFSNYFRWMEEVEHAFWRSHGYSVVVESGDRRISWPRVAVRCEYSSPARFEDEIEMSLTVAALGSKSATLAIRFARGGAIIARGEMKVVCCAVTPGGRFAAIEMPADLRACLEGAVLPGQAAEG